VAANFCVSDQHSIAADRLGLVRPFMSVDLQAMPPTIVANRMQLQQVLLNFVTNAIEAVGEVIPEAHSCGFAQSTLLTATS
jgi:C4-dicarboxylate-specific signal transduction histidine kinase